jgi:predicted phage terminase large subunit-like protein
LDAESAKMLNSVAEECAYINQEIENTKAEQEDRKPNIIEPNFYQEGDSCAPRRWPKNRLLKIKSSLSIAEWNAVYLQKPVQDGGNILKSTWWREWKQKEPPHCEFVMQVYDTAYKTGQENDYTARTTWGIFKHPDSKGRTRYCAILLEALEERIPFPELRERAYTDYKEYRPDVVIIEDKASGQSLIQELKKKRVPIIQVLPKHDKIARAHAVSVVLEQGAVFYINKPWALHVIDQCAKFPRGDHDDLVDTCIIAWKRLRDSFWLDLNDTLDEDEDSLAKFEHTINKPLYG